MSTAAKLLGSDFDAMVEKGAFENSVPMKVELIHGELRFMNPAGPLHEGEIEFLTEWSYATTDRNSISIRVQSGIQCGESRPEPDLVWIRKLPSRNMRPTHDDVLLLIEVSDTSLNQDLLEKADLYAQHDIQEYWVVDINNRQIHVHRTPINGLYCLIELNRKPATLSPLAAPQATLDIGELFSDLG